MPASTHSRSRPDRRSTPATQSALDGGDSAADSDSRTPRFGLTVPQVTGTALAAATSALAASFLGVAGTLIGAVIGSLVATIGGAVYSHSLKAAAGQLRMVRPQRRLVSVPGRDGDGQVPPGVDRSRVAVQPALTWKVEPPARRLLRLTAGLALGVVIALAGITAVELVMGHPVSGSTTSGTSIGNAAGNAPRTSTPATVSPSTTKTGAAAATASSTASVPAAASADANTATAPATQAGSGATATAPAAASISPTSAAVLPPAG